jgi:hypothetical protein
LASAVTETQTDSTSTRDRHEIAKQNQEETTDGSAQVTLESIMTSMMKGETTSLRTRNLQDTATTVLATTTHSVKGTSTNDYFLASFPPNLRFSTTTREPLILISNPSFHVPVRVFVSDGQGSLIWQVNAAFAVLALFGIEDGVGNNKGVKFQ